MPPKKGMQRGTKASLVTVVMTFEGFLKSCIQKILSNDENGTKFLKLQQETELLSPISYNKLAGCNKERKLSALIEKARNANEPQLLKLLDFIKKELGDNATLRIFRRQILNRPMIPNPPFNRTRSRVDCEKARQMEKTEVLLDCFKLTIQEALKEAEEMKEEKKKSNEACARADALQNENKDLKGQMEHFRQLYMALEKTKQENTELAEQLKVELEEQKRIARKHKADAAEQRERADKQQERADNLETELDEVKEELVQAQEDLNDQAKELEKKNIELEEYRKRLNDAMKEIDSLKGEMRDLKQQFEEVKDDNKSWKEMARQALSGVAALREENKQFGSILGGLQKTAQVKAAQFQILSAPTSLDRHARSLPSHLEQGCTFLPLINKKKAWEKNDLEEDKYEDEDSFP